MSSSSKCSDCEAGEHADTLQCEICWEDVCQKDKCANASGFTCKGCENTYCDACLDEVLFCQFCECCSKCDANVFPCDGCQDDERVMMNSEPYYACTKCRLDMHWNMTTNYRTGEVMVCCPDHPKGSHLTHDPIPESMFEPMTGLHELLMV